MSKEKQVQCPYCKTVFESEVDKGVHMAEEHVQKTDKVKRPNQSRIKDDSIYRDWKKNKEEKEDEAEK